MKTLLRLLVSLAILAVVVWRLGGVGSIGEHVARLDLALAAGLLVLNTADRAFMTYKWAFLLRARNVHLPLLRGMILYCAALVWGMLLPATVGTDAVRAVATSRSGVDSREVVASIVIERVIGFLSALLLGILGLLLLWGLGAMDARFVPVWWLAMLLLAAAALFFAASFSETVFRLLHVKVLGRLRGARVEKVREKLRSLHETYRAYRGHAPTLVAFFLMTFAEQLFPILHAWLIAVALGIEVSLAFVAAAVPLAVLVSRIPIGLEGIGTFEVAFIALMSLAGVDAAAALAIALTGRVLQLLSWLPWWLAQVLSAGALRPPQAAEG